MDEIMNKRPSLQFYPADWLKDPDLQMCSMNTIGIWINLVCRMWESKEEGIIKGKLGEIALLVGARPSEFKRFLREVLDHKFADVTKSNNIVTITCRRMNKVFLEREGTKKRVKEHRARQGNGNVTKHSSSSTSSSSTKSKNKHLDFVLLTKDEYSKLLDKFGETRTTSLIEELNIGLGSKGYKYKSHYFTILSWARRKRTESPPTKKTKLFPIAGHLCGKEGCKMPAVYKDTSGSYDSFFCSAHMPEKVKDKYE